MLKKNRNIKLLQKPQNFGPEIVRGSSRKIKNVKSIGCNLTPLDPLISINFVGRAQVAKSKIFFGVRTVFRDEHFGEIKFLRTRCHITKV